MALNRAETSERSRDEKAFPFPLFIPCSYVNAKSHEVTTLVLQIVKC